MDRVLFEYADHVVEISEEVIVGNNIHFATVEGNLGNHVPDTAKSVYSDLHH